MGVVTMDTSHISASIDIPLLAGNAGIGAQDRDRITMHDGAGPFYTTVGYVYAKCRRGADEMRRRAFR